MYNFIKGKIVEKNITKVIIEVQGIGYEIYISSSTYEKLPSVGEKVLLYVYLYVREDNMRLYGFYSSEEKQTFLWLITVPGVGPSLALRILSSITPEAFVRAVIEEKVEILKRIKGVGSRTAAKIILELSHILKKNTEIVESHKIDFVDDAILALISLGYKRSEAQKAVEKVISKTKPEKIDILIKEALKEI